MKKRQLILTGIALCMAMLLTSCKQECNTPPPPPKPAGTIKLGYMICNSVPETVARFSPAAAFIGRKLGMKVVMVPMHTYNVEDDVKKKGVQFFKINSIVYIQMKHRMDIQVLAGEKRGPLGRFTTGTIITRKGSPIKTIKDLKGKKFAFGPEFAPFGFLVQYDLMLKNGFNPDEDLQYYAIPWGANKHEKAIYNVQTGVVDAGSGPMLDLLEMTEKGLIRFGKDFPAEEQDFEVIAETAPAPYCTFACLKEADKELAKKIQKIIVELNDRDFVEMSPEWLEVEGVTWDKKGSFLQSGENLNVLKNAMIDGYEVAQDSDYDVIREMAKNVKMDPYTEY